MKSGASLDWSLHLKSLLAEDGIPGVIQMIENRGLFENWNRNSMPWIQAGSYLGSSIELAICDYDNPCIGILRSHALTLSQKILSDSDRWALDGDWGKLPLGGGNWFQAATTAEICTAWCCNAHLNDERLLLACEKLLEGIPSFKRSGIWNGLYQAQLMTAVIWLIYLERFDLVKIALASRVNTKGVAELRRWVVGLVEFLDAKSEYGRGQARIHFDMLYAAVRRPDWRNGQSALRIQESMGEVYPTNRNLFRFQLTLLRYKLFEEEAESLLDWRTLLTGIAAAD